MKKSIFLFFFLSISSFLLANQYWVEIAVANNPVDISSIKDKYTVKVVFGKNSYRYYIGNFFDETRAREVKEEAVSLGFHLSRIIKVQQESEICSKSCEPLRDLHNIFFDYNRFNLKGQSRRDLSILADILIDNPTYNVTLEAHTDSRGNDDYNLELSKLRAKETRKYLISKGILTSRITTIPMGESTPIAENDINGRDNAKGRKLNRRVMINILDSSGKSLNDLVKAIL